MELDDLKNDWENLTNQIHHQNMLTSKIISDITKRKYHSQINKIKYPEVIGGIICFLGLSYVGFNFIKLDSVFLQSIAVLAMLLLMIIPAVSFLSLTAFNSVDSLDKPYIETIKQFANKKLLFVKYQKINAFLSYLLLVTVIILLPKFFYGKDITVNKLFWIFSFSIGYLFLIFFSKWVKVCYGTTLRKAEELLKEEAQS